MANLEELCKENREVKPFFEDKGIIGYELKAKLQICEGCKNYKEFGGFHYCYLMKTIREVGVVVYSIYK